MQDMRKTKAQLVEELEQLRTKIARLESRDACGGPSVGPLSAGDAHPAGEKEAPGRANELILKSVLDHSSTVIYVKDLEGKYLLINRRYEELFDITNEEIAGKTDFDIFPPEAAQQFQAKDRKAIEAGGPIEEEEIVPQKDGVHTYISVKFPMYDEKGAVFATCGVSTDITERKRAEEALASHHEELEARVGERTRELTEVNRQLKAEVAERMRAEERVAIFQKFAEASGQGLGMADLDGKTTYLNPAVCRFLGLKTPEEGFGRHISEFHPKAERGRLTGEVVPAVLERGEWTGEMPLLNSNGEAVPMIHSMFLIRDENGNPQRFAAVLTDITERKRAEESLRTEQQRLMSLFDGLTEVVYVSDPKTYEILFANRFVREAFGKPLVGGICYRELQGLDEPCEFCTNDRILANKGEAYQWEHHNPVLKLDYLVTDKIIRWPDGRDVRFEVAIDITERKNAERALAESEERYRTIFDTAGTGMISFGVDSVITLANEQWANLSGYSIDETVGKLTWMPFFTEQSLAKMKKYHEMRTKDPNSVPKAYEAEFVDRAGGVHEGIINIQVVPTTQQRVASFQDLTELKRAQKEMYRADKMAALGQIIAGVAHEINNPNNFIFFNLPILRKYIEAVKPILEQCVEDDPNLRILNMPYAVLLEDVFKLLENMEHGSKRITSIVSDLKNYVRSDEDQDLRAEHVSQAVERVMTLVGKQVRKMVKRFDVDVAEGLPQVEMNLGKIEQVLINLVINAGQAADKDDSWVKLSAHPAADGSGWVELLVADNGSGIPEENLEQIFEPFFTSKGRELGTGLGLSISHRIVEEHGGTIDVESTVGEGSVFTVRLPAAPGV